MATFADKYGPWALITGASAGIGKEFARQLASRGLNVVLVARRADKLEALSKELQQDFQVETRTITCDLSQDDFLSVIQAGSDDLDISLLVNNAGAPSHRGWLINRSLEDIDTVLHMNIRVQVHLSHHFGNRIAKRGGGGIIQVASLAGHLTTPFMAEYSSSKCYQIRFTEALGYELREMNVDTLVLSPGGTKTERIDYGLPVEEVVQTGLDTLGKEPTLIVGNDHKWAEIKRQHLPTLKQEYEEWGAIQRSFEIPDKPY